MADALEAALRMLGLVLELCCRLMDDVCDRCTGLRRAGVAAKACMRDRYDPPLERREPEPLADEGWNIV